MFEGNELLSLIERLRGSFFHRADNFVVVGAGVQTKTSDYSLGVGDGTVFADPTAGDVVMTMPSVTVMSTRRITIKRVVATANTVYIIGSGIEKVEANLYGVYLPYVTADSALTFQCDGSQWRIVAHYGTDFVAAAPICDLQQPAASSLTSGVSTVDFGSVVVGDSSSPKTFTIQDDGRPNLGITSAAVGGGSSGDFPVNTAGMAAIIAYNATTTFAVTFTPTALGARSTTLTVTSTAGTFTVTLTGTGTGIIYAVFWYVGFMPWTGMDIGDSAFNERALRPWYALQPAQYLFNYQEFA